MEPIFCTRVPLTLSDFLKKKQSKSELNWIFKASLKFYNSSVQRERVCSHQASLNGRMEPIFCTHVLAAYVDPAQKK